MPNFTVLANHPRLVPRWNGQPLLSSSSVFLHPGAVFRVKQFKCVHGVQLFPAVARLLNDFLVHVQEMTVPVDVDSVQRVFHQHAVFLVSFTKSRFRSATSNARDHLTDKFGHGRSEVDFLLVPAFPWPRVFEANNTGKLPLHTNWHVQHRSNAVLFQVTLHKISSSGVFACVCRIDWQSPPNGLVVVWHLAQAEELTSHNLVPTVYVARLATHPITVRLQQPDTHVFHSEGVRRVPAEPLKSHQQVSGEKLRSGGQVNQRVLQTSAAFFPRRFLLFPFLPLCNIAHDKLNVRVPTVHVNPPPHDLHVGVLAVKPKQVFLKHGDFSWPCRIEEVGNAFSDLLPVLFGHKFHHPTPYQILYAGASHDPGERGICVQNSLAVMKSNALRTHFHEGTVLRFGAS